MQLNNKKSLTKLVRDFFVRNKDSLIPIEVKANKSTNNSSLTKYNQKYENNISIRLSLNNLTKDGKVINVPLFLIEYIDNLI